MLWINVPHTRDANDNILVSAATPDPVAIAKSLVEKRSMIGLVQAYSVSVKVIMMSNAGNSSELMHCQHMLRKEPGPYYEDLYPLISFLPQRAQGPSPDIKASDGDMLPLWRAPKPALHPIKRSPSLALSVRSTESDKDTVVVADSTPRAKKGSSNLDLEKGLPEADSERPLWPARKPPGSTMYDYFPPLRIFRWLLNRIRGITNSEECNPQSSLQVESNVPLEITLYLSSYLAWLLSKGLLSPAIAGSITNSINSLQECITSLACLRNTPLPFAYQTHLRMCLWFYLIFLPFEIYKSFEWMTIPYVIILSIFITLPG
jgi:ion channel-forming bestrophin family protein